VPDGVLASTFTAALVGVSAELVRVEADVSHGLPCFTIVGLPDASVRESRDRVRSAIRSGGLEFPPHRITVNLSPADLRKAGSSFDLPIALAVLAASGQVPPELALRAVVLGELALDGRALPCRGVLPATLASRASAMDLIVVPKSNVQEARLVPGVHVRGAASLADALRALRGGETDAPAPAVSRAPTDPHQPDLSDVHGQGLARRALEIAAAGHHNLLLSGPPGAGKSMLARRLPGLLPCWSFEEALEATAVHSAAGLVPPDGGLLATRPFRAPHHTVSTAALVGGGPQPRPGEVSLAHHGVLLLDEVPEFERRTLDVLRQPLEDGVVHLARASRSVTFPARFLLVAAMNPCPCGYRGHPRRACRCRPGDADRYTARISGPLLDRIDLVVQVPPVEPSALTGVHPRAEASVTVRARVMAARTRQLDRQGAVNSRLAGPAIDTLRRDPNLAGLLTHAMTRLDLSARAADRVLRVARTIADLTGAQAVDRTHLAEALQFRPC
jgi:magnesium chelatase family protein